MPKRAAFRAVAAAAIAAVAPAAPAQETARLIVEVSNPVLLPGQSTQIGVWVEYTPPVGGVAVWDTLGGTGQTGTVAGFSFALFHVLMAPAPGVSGSWSGLGFGPGISYCDPFGCPPGTLSGPNVINVFATSGFGPPVAPALTGNPLLLWFGTWTASSASTSGVVPIVTDVLQGTPQHPNTVHLWLLGGTIGNFAVEDAWPCTDGTGLITVIPSPGVAVVALAGAWPVARRRRPTRREKHAWLSRSIASAPDRSASR